MVAKHRAITNGVTEAWHRVGCLSSTKPRRGVTALGGLPVYLDLVRPELPMFRYTWALAAEGMKRKGVLHREKTPFTWVPLPGGAKEKSDVPSAGNNGLRAGSLNLARP